MIYVLKRAYFVLILIVLLALSPPGMGQESGLPEHPVIKPMLDSLLNEDRSRMDEYGTMSVRYRVDGRTVSNTVEGRFWHLEYQLGETATSASEIMSNYASEVLRVGGEVLDRSATRLRFRLAARGGSTTWGILDARSGGRYELDIVDEGGLDLSLEFDEDAMLEALNRESSVSLYGIIFDIDRADLLPGSGEVLDTIVAVLKADPVLRLEVQGHTDSTGSAQRNRELSLQRAQRIVAVLGLYGIDPDRLVPIGFGASQPMADNATEAGRQQNRRVQ
ncbi:MAG: OmpA family protein, partial [Pseudomonadales bacterium]|nr:OmpA family protein [Pseudomonadales bacterium]